MSNDMTQKPVFNYGLVTEDQAMQLREIAIRLGVRVQRTAEEMLAMGADLREAKRVCKDDGVLFTAWCESSECPIKGIRTVERLMAVHAALGDRNDRAVVFDYGFRVLADVTQTRDEDIRAALLEHIEKEAEDGNKVTQKEITALKKALKDAQLKAVELEESAFDARQERDRILSEKDKLAAREKEAREKKDQYARDLIEADKARKAIEAEYAAKLKAKQQELRDADEVHREHLEEMRRKIAEEERARPMTDSEIEARKISLEALRKQEAESKAAVAKTEREIERLNEELLKLNRDAALVERVLSDFAKASAQFRDVAIMMSGASVALKRIPMTDALYDQIQIIKNLAADVVRDMEEATIANQ